MKLVIDLSNNSVAGRTSDPGFSPSATQALADVPDGFDMEHASDWSFSSGTLTHDPLIALNRAKTARIARIKFEAAELIAATDWKLQRAREQEAAGWATLAEVDTVLTEREAIRRSSNAAELAVAALTDVASVQTFAWAVDVDVNLPARVTHATFLDALRSLGEDVIPTILSAKETNPALMQWWTYFDKATVIAATDPRLLTGLQGLEFAGLIPAGGAAAVIAALGNAAL